ncbi:hypothetical protein OG552_23725 [Streptomyces sp. NBC_01476]|uniref:hypothetical protein n=1 Tax=Streptomyces sp. NBC_01476 TaxID=2903881 RepID=UPI002E30735E|nr:hypothetical protein [Streptomyces sp. NBC_01476]
MTDFVPAPALRLACGETRAVPAQLIPAALIFAPAGSVPSDVERVARCTLQAHLAGDHHGFVLDLPGPDTGSVWTTWAPGGEPASVAVLPDCPVEEEATHEPCCEFAGHPGAHTFELTDPWPGAPRC